MNELFYYACKNLLNRDVYNYNYYVFFIEMHKNLVNI